MKYFVLLLITPIIFSCNNSVKEKSAEAKQDTLQQAIAYNKINCIAGESLNIQSQTNPAISFSIYTPKNFSESQSLPVIYFFDPHADGKLPLDKYSALADELNLFLVGCNSSQNGMSMEESGAAANAMITDCSKRMPINTAAQIVAGFSGGSKVACVTAMQHHFLSGLIACSGSVFEENAFADSLAIASVVGQKDFNYHEMVAFNKAVSSNPHIYIETSNTHEWPPADAMKMAFQFQILQTVAQKKLASDESLVKKWRHEWNDVISHYEMKKDVNMTHQTLSNAVESFKTTGDISAWQNKLMVIEKSSDYNRYVTKQRNIIYQEKEMLKMLKDAFVNQNISWWEKEISDLKTGEKQAGDPMISSMNGRLLGYIGIAAYSYSKQLVNENHKEAGKVLAIYKTAEPDNAEGWFLSAVYEANNNHNEQALHDFQKALEKGFKEQSRINDYPRLKNLIAP